MVRFRARGLDKVLRRRSSLKPSDLPHWLNMWVCLLHFVEPYRTLIGRPSAAGTWSEGKPRCTRSGANFSSAPWEFCSVESSRRVTSRCSPHKIWRIWFWMRCHFDPFGSVWAISFGTSKGSLRSGFSTLSTVQTWPRPRPFICTSARLEIEASDITSCFLLRMLVVQVHERSMDMDFVLTLLRHALPSRPELKALPVFYLWGIWNT